MLKGKPLDQRVMPERVHPPMTALTSPVGLCGVPHTAAKGKLIDEVSGDQMAGVEIGDSAICLGIEGVNDCAEGCRTELVVALCVRAEIDRVRVGIAEIER